MKYITMFVGGSGVLLLLVVSLAMNFRFGFSMGTTDLDGYIFGGASVGADLIKSLLPFMIALAWAAKRYLAAFISLFLMVLFSCYSLASSLGFAAKNRAFISASSQKAAGAIDTRRENITALKLKLAKLPKHRDKATIKAQIAKARFNKRWDSTTQCSDATLKESRAFCSNYELLRGELGVAKKAEALEKRLDALQIETSNAPIVQKDEQAGFLARLGGVDVSKAQLALVILLALLVEAGSGFGFYALFGHGAFSVAEKVTHLSEKQEPITYDGFFTERLAAEQGKSQNVATIYAIFRNWCETNHIDDLSLTAFIALMNEQGFHNSKIGGVDRFVGLRLKQSSNIIELKSG